MSQRNPQVLTFVLDYFHHMCYYHRINISPHGSLSHSPDDAVLMSANCHNFFCLCSSMDLSLTKNCSLTVTLRHAVKFVVIRHTKVWKRYHDEQDYLGFYTLDSRHMSASVHGLLGRQQEKISHHDTLGLFNFLLIPSSE